MRNPTRRGGRSAAAPFHPVVLAEGLEPRTLLSATDPLDVKNGPLAKVGPELIGAWNQFQNLLRSRGPAATAGFRPSDPLLHLGAGGGIEVEAYTNGNPAILAAELASLGATNIQSYANGASAAVPAAEISALAALPDLNFARPVEFTLNTGSVTSQGDSVLRGDVGRNQFAVNGSGVKVGVLSDSFNTASNTFTTDHYSTDVASGDLPAGVQVLQDTPGGTDEGRAMAQLVYDTAPGASLAFATAYNSQASFATNIKALRDAGCKVIVDDVSYFAEPMFQDGVIAQAVDNVVASGTSYFSAVGNEASQSYQDAFRPDRTLASGSIGPSFRGGVTHDFDPGPGVDDTQGFSLDPGYDITLAFEWDQPYFSVSGGSGSANDMDVYVLNAAGSKVLAASTTNNTGGDPVEVVSLTNNRTTTQSYQLMIVKASGSAPGLMKYVDYGSANFSEWKTNSSTDYGHSNAAGAAGVAAARYSSPTSAESYSSLGGTPILFDTAGNRLATQVTRQSPRFTAPDGGNTTFFYPGDDFEGDGHPNFFGTSAAAPAAAAVAALMLQLAPTMTPASVYSTLQSTAQDMGTAGYDFLTGSGLIRADAAIASELGITASGGAAYQVTGSPGSRLLSVTAGTVTLGKDLSSFYPGISLSVSGAATAVFSVDQTFFNVSLADNGQIAVGTPPGGGANLTTGDGDIGSGSQTATAMPTPTPTSTSTPSTQSQSLTAEAAGYARDGAYAGTDLSSDPTLVVKTGPAGYTRQTFLTFDLSKHAGPIHAAHLRLFGRLTGGSPADVKVGVSAATGSFTKGHLTWNHRPTATGNALATATVTGTQARWYDWDLSAFLKAQKAAGKSVVTLALRGVSPTEAAALFDSGKAGKGPRLIMA